MTFDLVYCTIVNRQSRMEKVSIERKRCWETCRREYLDTFFRLGEVFLAFANGLLILVTFGTPYWIQLQQNDTVGADTVHREQVLYHAGLWQNCSVAAGCERIPLKTESYLIASRLFMCVALISGLAAWTISIVSLVQHKTGWLMGAAIFYGIEGFLLLIGLAAHSRGYHDSRSPGWSYTVGWITFVLSLICSVYFTLVALYGKNRHQLPSRNQNKVYAPLSQFEVSTASEDEDL